jgi:hypothetical protein
LPVLLVAAADAAPLLIATQSQNGAATVKVHGIRRVARGTNVVAYLPASPDTATSAPFGLLTPKSGWYTCAAERGGGIAVWLQTLALASQRRSTYGWIERHELGIVVGGVSPGGRTTAASAGCSYASLVPQPSHERFCVGWRLQATCGLS